MKDWIKYLITFGVGAAMTISAASIMGIFSAESTADIIKILCDAFAITGVLLLGAGLLVFASNAGMFSMITYGAIMFVNAFRRDVSARKYESYYDYTEAKKNKKIKNAHLLWNGLLFLVIAVIFLIIFHEL